jgi:hypothetical protein
MLTKELNVIDKNRTVANPNAHAKYLRNEEGNHNSITKIRTWKEKQDHAQQNKYIFSLNAQISVTKQR